jgi:hypothetical protein
MFSGLPLVINRANSSGVNGKLSLWECRIGLPKKRLNQSASRLICGISRPNYKTRLLGKVSDGPANFATES